MKFSLLTRSLSLTIGGLALSASLLIPTTACSQQPEPPNALGVVHPTYTVEKSVIAIAPFGTDGNVAMEFETMPRVIRRDLDLSGFFEMPSNQSAVNSQNVYDVQNKTVMFEKWKEMGVDYYLMGSVSQPTPSELRVRVIFYDVNSRENIINQYITGPANDPRNLAHKISDEVVRYTKFTEGIAQTKLLYVSQQIPRIEKTRSIREIAITDADGFNQRNVTKFADLCITPTWGANGTEIYYTSYKGNVAHIYGQMLSSGQVWTIAGYGGTNHSPNWNQNRRQVLMTLSKDGNSELYAVQRDGQNLVRLTKTPATEGSPCWSPDGSKFVYVSNEAGGAHLFVANADGSGKKRLTHKGNWNDAPTWSPDGKRIAFVSSINSVNDIFIIDANGNNDSIKRLTMNQGDNESPSWAHNSRHLSFSSNRSGNRQIYLMLDDGSNQKPITTSGRNTQPDWGPMPKKK